jgi:hypothetical protein
MIDVHKKWIRSMVPAKINSERVYGVLADQCPSMELDLNEVSRVSAPRIFEFTIAAMVPLSWSIAVSGRVRDTSTQEAIEINIAVSGRVRDTSTQEAIEIIAVLTRMRYRSIAQVYEFQGFSQSRCTSCVQEPL